MTKGDAVVKVALAEVGVTEVPMGSNTGPRVRQYQAATDLGGTGWPWCSAFVEWCWKRVGGIDTAICSPSTAVFAARAISERLTGACRPGAAVCWAPRHVEIAVAPTSDPNIWHCVGGNVSDGVRRTIRDIRGATIIVPEALRKTQPRPKLYWFEDPGAKRTQRFLGPWLGKRGLATARRVAKKRPAWEQPRVKRVGKDRFGVLIGQRSIYGPWQDAPSRNRAMAIIKKRVNRQLRPYATPRPLDNASAEAFGKTD